MTGNWIWVPFTALVCYLYLLLILLAAKKNRAIYSFIILLCAMACWTEGALMMRLQSWPGYQFWYHVSFFALLFMVHCFYYCVGVFLEIEKPPRLGLWFIILSSAGILNALCGLFLPPPRLQPLPGGEEAFLYHISPSVIILFLICMLVIGDTIRMYTASQADGRTKRQLMPLFIGFAAMVAGHLLICLPFFAGIPLNIFTGVFNALCMFYAFRRKRLLRLNLLLSRNICYIVATALAMFSFFFWFSHIQEFIMNSFPKAEENITLLLSVLSVLVSLCIYQIARFIIDRLFVRDETVRAEKLRSYCFNVSQTFDETEILKHTFRMIIDNTPAERIFACMADADEYIIYDSRTGSSNNINLRSGVLLSYFMQNPGCWSIRELEHTMLFREMDELERRILQKYKIGCLVSLANDHFFGLLAVCSKSGSGDFSYEDLAFLESVESIASMALRNAEVYEKARIEARTDVLTGMLNRRAFYEKLSEKCSDKQDTFSLILVNLDDFKLFNQLYGVNYGDSAICVIANLLSEMAGKDSHTARYGGKEFGVILPYTAPDDAKKLTKEFLNRMNGLRIGNSEKELNILTASCGICSFPDGADTPEELLSHAEMAVYHVKQHGKNDVVIYQEVGGIQEDKEKQEIYSSYASTIFALTAAIDTKDHYTFNHSQNVAYYARGLARLLNKNEDFIELVREAALLHDIGKIGIPEAILNKPGRLTEEEYAIMQGHVENSIGIIRHLPSLHYVIPAVICHHERFDGKGYPRRVAGIDIPLSGRILCIADSFDAMVSRRSYKEPYALEKAISIILEERGTQFDPELAVVFVEGIRSGKIKMQV